LHSRASVEPQPLLTPERILALQQQLPMVYGNEGLLHYIVQLAEASRSHPDLALGASPRAALVLLKCARARALLHGRHYFTHEDVQAMAPGVLCHRLILRPEADVEGKLVIDVVNDLLKAVPVVEPAAAAR
jgi:MoxR-like ATPase